MNYEKKYKEALEKARQFSEHPLEEDSSSIVEYIFPELQESLDEKIRKWLIDTIKSVPNDSIEWDVINKSDVLAWLEKQGDISKLSEEEQNRFAKGVLSSCALSFINYLDAHKYEGKMCVSNGECEDIENAFHNAMWDRLHRYYCKYIEKQGEKKPIEWNERDERVLTEIINDVKFTQSKNPNSYMNQLLFKKEIDWLKSLKQRMGG